MLLGILGIGYGFLTAPKNIQDVEKILAKEEAEHGGEHGEANAHNEVKSEGHSDNASAHSNENHEAKATDKLEKKEEVDRKSVV